MLLVIVAAICSLTSCKKDDETDYSKLLIGTWVLDNEDGTDNYTDDKCIFIFKADMTDIYAQGYKFSDSSYWEETQEPYSIIGSQLTIDDSGYWGPSSYLVVDLTRIDDNHIIFTEKLFMKDGVDQGKDTLCTYTMRRAQVDYSNEIKGLWKGHETTPGTTYAQDWYWEYLDGNKYKFYYYDSSIGKYSFNDKAEYYLYGDLIISYFLNNNGYLGGTIGKYEYENWMVSIKNDTMYWNAKREGGIEKSYMMVKTTEYPEIK